MASLVSIGSSVPSNGNTPYQVNISSTPTRLAAFGINVADNSNRVFLKATIGARSTLLTPTLVFRIVRDDSEVVASYRQQLLVSATQFQTVSIHAVDTNVPPGYHGYSVTVAIEGLLADATITGPVVFSGESYTF